MCSVLHLQNFTRTKRSSQERPTVREAFDPTDSAYRYLHWADIVLYKPVGRTQRLLAETIIDPETKKEHEFSLALYQKSLGKKLPVIYAALPSDCKATFLFKCCSSVDIISFVPYHSSDCPPVNAEFAGGRRRRPASCQCRVRKKSLFA